jgi:hypothetical protein
MDLVERYLNAIRFWLPKDQKSDVIAELSEDIRQQVEDREHEPFCRGRTLSSVAAPHRAAALPHL